MEPDNFRYRRALGGGALWDLGPYAAAVGRVFLDDEPASVACRVLARGGPDGVETAFFEPSDGFAGCDGDTFLLIIRVEELGEFARINPVADAGAGENDGDLFAVHRERSGDFRADESAADDNEAFAFLGKLAESAVIFCGAIINYFVSVERKKPRLAARRQ